MSHVKPDYLLQPGPQRIAFRQPRQRFPKHEKMMIDIQSQRDDRNIPIDKVGIKNLRYPITVRDRRNGRQHTVATINMYVDLPRKYKGTHMSRFVEMLHMLQPEISLTSSPYLAR